MKDCQTGFKKGAKPLYVIYWSKGGLALYNEKKLAIFYFWMLQAVFADAVMMVNKCCTMNLL